MCPIPSLYIAPSAALVRRIPERNCGDIFVTLTSTKAERRERELSEDLMMMLGGSS